jgi:hypothetical protein
MKAVAGVGVASAGYDFPIRRSGRRRGLPLLRKSPLPFLRLLSLFAATVLFGMFLERENLRHAESGHISA